MRLSLLCAWTSWILTLHAAAQHHPPRDEAAVKPGDREGVRTGWRRRQSTGGPTPPRPDANKAARGSGERRADGRRRATLTG